MRQGRKKGRTATAKTTKHGSLNFITEQKHIKKIDGRILNYYCISYTTAVVVVGVAHRLGAPHYFVI